MPNMAFLLQKIFSGHLFVQFGEIQTDQSLSREKAAGSPVPTITTTKGHAMIASSELLSESLNQLALQTVLIDPEDVMSLGSVLEQIEKVEALTRETEQADAVALGRGLRELVEKIILNDVPEAARAVDLLNQGVKVLQQQVRPGCGDTARSGGRGLLGGTGRVDRNRATGPRAGKRPGNPRCIGGAGRRSKALARGSPCGVGLCHGSGPGAGAGFHLRRPGAPGLHRSESDQPGTVSGRQGDHQRHFPSLPYPEGGFRFPQSPGHPSFFPCRGIPCWTTPATKS